MSTRNFVPFGDGLLGLLLPAVRVERVVLLLEWAVEGGDEDLSDDGRQT